MSQISLLAYTNLHKIVEERIARFVEKHRARLVYVMFSAGKDSSAVLAAAMRAVPDRVVAVYNVIAGQTHAINTEAARKVATKAPMLMPM